VNRDSGAPPSQSNSVVSTLTVDEGSAPGFFLGSRLNGPGPGGEAALHAGGEYFRSTGSLGRAASGGGFPGHGIIFG
jgi:hypothetical protein